MIKAAIPVSESDLLQRAVSILEDSPSVSGIFRFQEPKQLLDILEDGKEEPDAVFLPLGSSAREKSLGLASALYRMRPRIPVIFLTETNADFDQTILLENANVAGFVCAPLNQDVFERYILKLIHGRTGRRMLTFFIRGSQYELKADEIFYIESRGHIAMITTANQRYCVYEKLSELKKRLPQTFMQSHKSYLVNMKKVVRMEQSSLILENGTVIPISRSKKQDITNGLLKMKDGQI